MEDEPNFAVLPPAEAAARYAEIRRDLQDNARRQAQLDMRLVATAVAVGDVVVSDTPAAQV